MAILGKLLKKGINLSENLIQQYSSPYELQRNQLKHLLVDCRHTMFGEHYRFHEILKLFKSNSDDFYSEYKSKIPVFDYNKIYSEWWFHALEGKKDVCYPGKVRFFALSSGTSGASSKYIPVTNQMLRSIRKTSIRQILSLSKYDLSNDFYTKGILMLGGSTSLKRNQSYFEGDLSGITASHLPFWFQHFYKPGKKIAKNSDWENKLEEITKAASKWDIGIVVGVPSWIQLLIEKIIKHYQVANIHEIWPNLQVFVHGGVSFEPYRKGFEKLLARPLIYMETYLASEGFLAFQALPNKKSMRLVLNNGIFYEFIPFNSQNFDDDGELKNSDQSCHVGEVKEGVDYAIVISTNSGAWRYLIGDVIRFVDVDLCEIVITGRTKHFLSLCGEHLSIDNMNEAIRLAADEFNIDIKEYTVLGQKRDGQFQHNWFVGTEGEVDSDQMINFIDAKLKILNDDYRVERAHVLKDITLQLLPPSLFYEWLKKQGKEGGQVKFPRVLKNEKLADWKSFISEISDF